MDSRGRVAPHDFQAPLQIVANPIIGFPLRKPTTPNDYLSTPSSVPKHPLDTCNGESVSYACCRVHAAGPMAKFGVLGVGWPDVVLAAPMLIHTCCFYRLPSISRPHTLRSSLLMRVLKSLCVDLQYLTCSSVVNYFSRPTKSSP